MEPVLFDFQGEKAEFYRQLCAAGEALCEGESHFLANLSNLAALLGQTLPDINWAGFYLLDEGELTLAPFWGKPACLRIAYGKGVCGTAWQKNAVQRVADVHEFAGHIACDSASASEMVLLLRDESGQVFGVLDIDSPQKARFDEADEKGLRAFAELAASCGSREKCGYHLK